jgi:hypothetical protein
MEHFPTATNTGSMPPAIDDASLNRERAIDPGIA